MLGNELNFQSKNRYDRQIAFQPVGLEGQDLINDAQAHIIGCGALGNSICDCLARAGLGQLSIFDFDCVDLSNLQRQILFTEADIGKKKVDVAFRRLRAVNQNVKVNTNDCMIYEENIDELLCDAKCIVDAGDSPELSLLLNRFCVRNNVPFFFAGIAAALGNFYVYLPGRPCLACFFPEDISNVPTARQLGILPSLPQVAGGILATEIIKWIVNEEPVNGYVHLDIWKNHMKIYQVPKNRECVACAEM